MSMFEDLRLIFVVLATFLLPLVLTCSTTSSYYEQGRYLAISMKQKGTTKMTTTHLPGDETPTEPQEDDEDTIPEPEGKIPIQEEIPETNQTTSPFARYNFGGLRLTGGLNSSYGIVEVNYGGVWGTICDDFMKITKTSGSTTAEVICNLLGFPMGKDRWFSFAFMNIPSGVAVAQSRANKIWLDDFYCRGSETSLDQCIHSSIGAHDCIASENIGVICDSSPVTELSTTTPENGIAESTLTMSSDSTSNDLLRTPRNNNNTEQIISTTFSSESFTATSTPDTLSTTLTTAITTIGTSSTTAVTTPSTPWTITDQNRTPPLASPTPSSCGHSRYYHNVLQQPGAGVVGGVIAQQNQYPWIARLTIETSSATYICAGSIISQWYVLTAAHCIYGLNIISITANLGDHSTAIIDIGEIVAPVSTWTAHPLFNSQTNDYDFALLRLSQELTFTNWYVQPICLPSTCDAGCSNPGSLVYIAGWGTTSLGGSHSQYLRTAYVQIGDRNVCRSQYSYLTDRMVCAGYMAGGIDTCQGDSGGPLMSIEDGHYNLCGITSFGNGCALANNYGVYSRVCSVLPWIKTNTGLA